jgi:SAM-dependent methyltransferase
MPADENYVLGTHDEEIARLGLQHSVWRPRATAAWRRAGFRAGQTIVDVGCGPGYAALDLAEVVGPSGRVVAIDRSRRFLDCLEARARALDLSQVETVHLDLDVDDLPACEADGVWTRWVYSFVTQPRQLLERAARLLRRGGAMVVHEYVDYGAWRTSPRVPEHEEFVAEVMASWRASGGEPDVGLHLPQWISELGLEVRSLAPLVEATRRSDHVWAWPTAFMSSGVWRLVELGRISEDRARAILAAYESFAEAPAAFQITPTVIEIIAVRT